MTMLHSEIQKANNLKALKMLADRIAVSEPDKLHRVLQICLDSSKQVAGRASWLFTLIVKADMRLINSNIYSEVIECIRNTPYATVRRNLLHILQFLPIHEEYLPELTNLVLAYLSDSKQEIAVRAYSITILQHCTKLIPELAEEVMFLLEREMPYAPLSVKVRARRYMISVSNHK